MTTSGSYTFDPTVATLMDNAFARAGVDQKTITSQHISTAKTLLNLMMIEWAAQDPDAKYRIVQGTSTVASGTSNFTLATGAVDVVDLVIEYNSGGRDLPIARISRQDYLNITDKTETGRPSSYYVDNATLNTPKVYFWPVPDAQIDVTYDYLRYVQTVSALSETLDSHRLWLEAITANWASKIALVYNAEKYPLLAGLADRSYQIAKWSGSGKARIVVGGRGFGSIGRQRRV